MLKLDAWSFQGKFWVQQFIFHATLNLKNG